MAPTPEFDLAILAQGSGYTVTLRAASGVDLPPEPLQLTMQLPAMPAYREIARYVEAAREPRLGPGEELRNAKRVGGALFNALFSREVLARFRAARDALPDNGRLLVRLRLPPTLVGIPWELLYDAPNDQFIAVADDLALVRCPEMANPLRPLQLTGALQVLVVLASPRGVRPIDLDRELARVQAALRDPIAQERVALEVIRGTGTLEQLRRRLTKPVHVLHILCHGDLDEERGEGVLLFEDSSGDKELISAAQLRMLIEKQRGQTRLVLLNSCLGAVSGGNDPFGSVGAALMRGGVPAVVAMQFEISADSAQQLARIFYTDLADGRPIDMALTEARRHLFGYDSLRLDWAIPALFLRGNDGALFSQASAPTLPPAEPIPAPKVDAALEAVDQQQWTTAHTTLKALLAEQPDDAAQKQPTNPTRSTLLIGLGLAALVFVVVASIVFLRRTPASTALPTSVPATVGELTPVPTVLPTSVSVIEIPTATVGKPSPDLSLLQVPDGATLTFVEVPSGTFRMGASNRDTNALSDENPQHPVTLPTYWIGKTEVTNAQYRPFVTGDGYSNPAYWTSAGWAWRETNNIVAPAYWANPTLNGNDLPVSGMSWYEAMAYCRWLISKTGEDIQLPTEAEWEKAARGTDERIYPWGDIWNQTYVQSEGDSPIPVGSYPAGTSPYGALDMAGNVWEWTRSEYRSYPYNPNDGRENGTNSDEKQFIFRGGGWYNGPIYLRASNRGNKAPDNRSRYVGFRLTRHSPTETPTATVGEPTTDLSLLQVPGGASLTFVEVPGGAFLMGASDRDTNALSDEQPQHPVTLPTYWIGKTEVTNAQYRLFVTSNGYSNPAYWTSEGWAWRETNNIVAPANWDNSTLNGDDLPVSGMSWYEAMAYCRWLSSKTGEDIQLPTEAEWEKAARGTDERIYPWGDIWNQTYAQSEGASPRPIGSYPAGASPYGALDMAGNVWEWTRSEDRPYPYNPNDGREDVADPAKKPFTLRGGGWRNRSIYLRASYRDYGTPDYHGDFVGVRLTRHRK